MSLEFDAETVIIEILQAQAALAAFEVVHMDEETEPSDNRISVNIGPREVELYGRNLGIVKFWRLPIEIELFYVTDDVDAYNAVIAAIENAMIDSCGGGLGTGQIPDAAATAWISAFGALTNAQLQQTSDGSQETASKTRRRVKSYSFLAENV